jgi:glutaredoxin-like protein
MGLLSEQDEENVRAIFRDQLKSEVQALVFTQEHDCDYCVEARELMEELSRLDGRIKVKSYDLDRDLQVATIYGVDKTPAIIVARDGEKGRIRFFGLPAGHEFAALLEDLIDVSNGTSRLSPTSKAKISEIDRPLHIQVFVTTTCPHCPLAVRTAHQIALESEMVTADMIESMEFRQIALKYNVSSVPKTIINDRIELVGALPEGRFIDSLLSALRTLDAMEKGKG